MKQYIRIGTLTLLIFFLYWNLPAQENTGSGTGISEEEPPDGLFIDLEDEELASSLEKELLTSESVVIGGTYAFSRTSSLKWNASNFDFENITDPDEDTLETDLQTSIYLDARPG